MTTSTPTTFSTLTGDYTFDTAHSRLGFVARHAMVTKVRGSFNEFEGTAKIDGDNPANSVVALTIQVASVDTRNEQRDGHLRTNDFLDIEKFPTITFTSTEMRQTRVTFLSPFFSHHISPFTLVFSAMALGVTLNE
jgi:polyisoprenoid-binding protein YceI